MKTKKDNKEVYNAIYEIVRCVPKGRVTSYGVIATAAGLKSGARMVARAMSHSKGAKPAIPVHRVVNSSGVLSGDDGKRKKKLEAEGVAVEKGKVKNFKQLFWDPLLEIEI